MGKGFWLDGFVVPTITSSETLATWLTPWVFLFEEQQQTPQNKHMYERADEKGR